LPIIAAGPKKTIKGSVVSNTPTSDGTGNRILRVKEKKREIDVIVPPGVELVGFGDTNGYGKIDSGDIEQGDNVSIEYVNQDKGKVAAKITKLP
jgi:hypothetical protein